MTIADIAGGPRTDLPYLRRRRTTRTVAPAPTTPTTPTVAPAPDVLAVTAPHAAPPVSRRTAPPPPLTGFPVLAPGATAILDEAGPVVMLDRLASGIGRLACRYVSAASAQIAVAYEVRGAQGVLIGPGGGHGPDPHHPRVTLSGTEASIDLGHLDELRRFAVVVLASAVDGALTLETHTGVRLDVELRAQHANGTLVALTGHVSRGTLVLRAERRHIPGALRDAVTSLGYDAITWASADRPLTPHH